MNYEKKILDLLVDKYENSKSFIGDNKRGQSFSISLSKAFPSYIDHSDYEAFSEINEAIRFLERHAYVVGKKKGSVYDKLILNTEDMEAIYGYLHRKPKSIRNANLRKVLMKYRDQHPILMAYCDEQLQRLDQNKSVLWLGEGTINDLEQLLLGVSEALRIEEETYLRDFSVRVYGDSKVFEKLVNKIVGLLYAYGDFSDQHRILGELNLVKNPSYIHIKGALRLVIQEQSLDLSRLNGDLALSAALLEQVQEMELIGNRVLTVENLTSFHTMPCEDRLIIYLGGFHNSVSRKFLKKLYEQNPKAIYEHFGDIDAGGFYILEHLKKMTGIPFQAYRMDISTLEEYADRTKPLTQEDKKRLKRFSEGPYCEVAAYMLKNNCKLEQEAIQD